MFEANEFSTQNQCSRDVHTEHRPETAHKRGATRLSDGGVNVVNSYSMFTIRAQCLQFIWGYQYGAILTR